MIKSCYHPLEETTNQYVDNVVKSLKESNIEVLSYDEIKKNKTELKKVDIINLNWFETIYSKNSFKATLKMIKKIIEIIYCKLLGIKIIYTVHNKVPHEEKNIIFVRILTKFLCKVADRIVILSSGTNDVLLQYINQGEVEKKVVMIPIPNYIGDYKDMNKKSDKDYNPDELKLLFMGQIRPYKNIELLIEVAKEFTDKPIKFIIAGKPQNEEYKEKLNKLIGNEKNIYPLLHFIKDDDISELINMSDALILPFDLRSSLNSSTIILGFSYGKTLISPYISTLQDYDSDLFFSYNYETKQEHKEELISKINEIYNIFNEDSKKLVEMGNGLKESVIKLNSKELVIDKYAELYSDLINSK